MLIFPFSRLFIHRPRSCVFASSASFFTTIFHCTWQPQCSTCHTIYHHHTSRSKFTIQFWRSSRVNKSIDPGADGAIFALKTCCGCKAWFAVALLHSKDLFSLFFVSPPTFFYNPQGSPGFVNVRPKFFRDGSRKQQDWIVPPPAPWHWSREQRILQVGMAARIINHF